MGNRYSDKYYKRHLDKYRVWENAIGKDIFKTFNPYSILDLGCGVGSYLEGALLDGCEEVLGVELNFSNAKMYFTDIISPFIIQGDVTKDLELSHKFDCVISFEVGEHIIPDGTDGFISNLIRYSNDYIIITAAPPGQRGTGHINLRERDFWINEIESRGTQYDDELTRAIREIWGGLGAAKYVLNNLMIFHKRGGSWEEKL